MAESALGRCDPKAGLLDLLDEALEAGWTVSRVCHELELGEVRAHTVGSVGAPTGSWSTWRWAGPASLQTAQHPIQQLSTSQNTEPPATETPTHAGVPLTSAPVTSG